MTTAVAQLERVSQQIPVFTPAHWLLRLPLAGILLHQGVTKFPLLADDAAAFGVPFFMWALAAFGEIAVAVMLIAGAFIANGLGNLVTRLAGVGIAVIVASVLVIVYWAPPMDLLLGNQLHILLIVGGLYFALRGNAA
ncbi:MAG: hypothetical protein AAF909_10160 [Pseudomonadota bacterium]